MSPCWAQAITHSLWAWGDRVGGSSLPARAGTEGGISWALLLTFTWVRIHWLCSAVASAAAGNGKLLPRWFPTGKDHLWCSGTGGSECSRPSYSAFPAPAFSAPWRMSSNLFLSTSYLTPINNCPNWECWWRIFPEPSAKWLQWLCQSFFNLHREAFLSGDIWVW